MQFQDIQIPCIDDPQNLMLAATVCSLPETKQQRQQQTTVAIIFGSAMGVPRAFYRKLAEYFVSSMSNETRKVTAIMFDFRGTFQSKAADATTVSLLNWGRYDLDSVYLYAKNQLVSQKILYFGHSVSGQMLSLMKHRDQLSGCVFTATQSGYWKLWSRHLNPINNIPQKTNQLKPDVGKWQLILTWFLYIPLTSMFLSKVPGLGTPAGVARQWAAAGRQENYIFDLFKEQLAAFRPFSCPVLSFSFEADWYGPRAACEWIFKKYCPTGTVQYVDRIDDTQAKTSDGMMPLQRLIHIGGKDGLALGHFGFQRSEQALPLWTFTKEFFERCLQENSDFAFAKGRSQRQDDSVLPRSKL